MVQCQSVIAKERVIMETNALFPIVRRLGDLSALKIITVSQTGFNQANLTVYVMTPFVSALLTTATVKVCARCNIILTGWLSLYAIVSQVLMVKHVKIRVTSNLAKIMELVN